MKLVNYKKFLEVSLNLPLLRSENNGKQKGDTLVKKLNEPDPELRLNTGEVIDLDSSAAKTVSKKITTNGEYDSEKAIDTFTNNSRYKEVIQGENGKIYKLNNFKKDSEFGSSGAGVNTRIYENLQCIYLAHKLIRPNIDLTYENVIRLLADYNDNNKTLSNVLQLHLPNTDKIDEILVSALTNADWETTLVEVTNDLFNFTSRNKRIFPKELNGKYHVYHISCDEKDSPFKLIANKFNYLLKMESKNNMSALSFGDSALKIEFSKYCPADVIVVKDNINLEGLLEVESISALTLLLNNLFSNRLLVPISLKKVGVTKNSVKSYNIIVNNELERPLPEFEIESFTLYDDLTRGIGSKINVTSSWRDAKNLEIDGEDRSLTIDSSNTSNKINVDGEVEGKFSRHGKISFSYMKYFINSVRDNITLNKVQNLDNYSSLNNLKEEEIIYMIELILTDLKKIEKMYSRRIIINYPKRKSNKNSNVSTGRLIGSNNKKNKLISKLQSLQIILAIIQVKIYKVKEANHIINSIMRYALSIQADVFVTPRYVRVI